MAHVNKRGGFSDRNNIRPINTAIQISEFDERTRNAICTFIFEMIKSFLEFEDDYFEQRFWNFVFSDIYGEFVDPFSKITRSEGLNCIKDTILCNQYHEVLTLMEAIINYIIKFRYQKDRRLIFGALDEIVPRANALFKAEYVGYRFVGKMIVPISDENEVSEMTEAIKTRFRIVGEHIQKASGFLANRENPDYENCIKESITAVEALCNIITKSQGATLGSALKKLEENGIPIHGSLKLAFDKLYGYTSDANGIRHAGQIDGPGATFEEAKYMLVSCCAFVNYLTALYSKIKDG